MPAKHQQLNELQKSLPPIDQLFLAVMSGDKKLVRSILQGKPENLRASFISHSKKDGNTVLHIAVMKNFHDIVRLLVEMTPASQRETVIKCKANNGEFALLSAVKRQNIAVINSLLSPLAPKQRLHVIEQVGPNGLTALILAAAIGQSEIVKLLLQLVADEKRVGCIMQASEEGITALMAAAMEGHEDVVATLLNITPEDQRINIIQQKLDIGATALFYAIVNGHQKTVERLLDMTPENSRVDVIRQAKIIHINVTAVQLAVSKSLTHILETVFKYVTQSERLAIISEAPSVAQCDLMSPWTVATAAAEHDLSFAKRLGSIFLGKGDEKEKAPTFTFQECSMWESLLTYDYYVATRRCMDDSGRYATSRAAVGTSHIYQRPNPNHPNRIEPLLTVIYEALAQKAEDSAEKIAALVYLEHVKQEARQQRTQQKSLAHYLKIFSQKAGVALARDVLFAVTKKHPVFQPSKTAKIIKKTQQDWTVARQEELPKVNLRKRSTLSYDAIHEQRREIVCELAAENGEGFNDKYIGIAISAPKEGYPCLIIELYDYLNRIRTSAYRSLKGKQLKDDVLEQLSAYAPDDGVMAISALLSAYLARITNYYCKKSMGDNWIWTDYQQSFGSLRPTFSDTGFAIRLSPGLIPQDYYGALKEALSFFKAVLSHKDTEKFVKEFFSAYLLNKLSKKEKNTFPGKLRAILKDTVKREAFLEYIILSFDGFKPSVEIPEMLAIFNDAVSQFSSVDAVAEYQKVERERLIKSLSMPQQEGVVQSSVEEQQHHLYRAWIGRINETLSQCIDTLMTMYPEIKEYQQIIQATLELLEPFHQAHKPLLSWNEKTLYIEQAMKLLTLAYEVITCINTSEQAEIPSSTSGINSVVTQGIITGQQSDLYCATSSSLHGMSSLDFTLNLMSETKAILGIASKYRVLVDEVYFEYAFKMEMLQKDSPHFEIVDLPARHAAKDTAASAQQESLADIFVADLSPYPQLGSGITQSEDKLDKFKQISCPIVILDVTGASEKDIASFLKEHIENKSASTKVVYLVASDNKYGQPGGDLRSRGEVRIVFNDKYAKAEGISTDMVSVAGGIVPINCFINTTKLLMKLNSEHYNAINTARDRLLRDLGIRRTFKKQEEQPDYAADAMERFIRGGVDGHRNTFFRSDLYSSCDDKSTTAFPGLGS